MENTLITNLGRAKLSKIMLLVSFMLCVAFSTHARMTETYALAKKFTVKLENKTVKNVFDYIEKNSEYIFLYYADIVDMNRRVTVNVKNQPVNAILDVIFKNTNLTYEIDNRQIVISSKKTAPAVNSNKNSSTQEKQRLTGKVVDEAGEPLPGVIVLVVGSTRGVSTDVDGTFEIDVRNNEKLKFSYLGMRDQEIPVDNQKMLLVKLLPKVDELQEVTVVAYGKQKKESVIGAITSVSATELKLSNSKLSTGLAGQLAGIVSVQRNGEPGSDAEFWIRGISTFGADKTPLVLVDGVERPLNQVDTDDIESFSILKDATATAVYGVRGANGIVLITTKRGREGKPVINARIEYGLSSPTRMPRMASAEQYIDFYNEVEMEKNGIPAYTPEEKQRYLTGYDPDLYPNVNWMEEIYKDMSTTQRVNLSVSGGSKKVRYYVAGSFVNENGIYNVTKGEGYNPELRWNRFNFRSNLDIDVTPSTELNVSLSNQYDTKNRPYANDMWTTVMKIPSTVTPKIYSDGTLALPLAGVNPWNNLNKRGYTEHFSNFAQTLIGITQDLSKFVTPGLKVNVKYAWDATNHSSLTRTKNPSTYYAIGRDVNGNLEYKQSTEGNNYLTLSKTYSGSRQTNFEASVTYDRVFGGDHRVGGLFLFNMKEYTTSVPDNYIAAFPNRNQGIAGRATYSYQDKYFIEGNFGYNGSENFAPGHQFGFFPSIALGYLVSNESYFEPLLSIVSLLKLKGSHGLIGSDKIGGSRRFAFNTEMAAQGGYHFGETGGYNLTGYATGYPGNPNVGWETAKKTNIGIELGFFNALKLQADYFKERRSGIFILRESVPSVVGNNIEPNVNLGEMENQGFDASLEYMQRINDFVISARGNFTYNRNRKLYDDKPTPIMPYQKLTGVPYGQQTGFIADGLFESEEDIANSPYHSLGTVRPGDIKYRDINGDGAITLLDEVNIGRTAVPEINYGFGASVAWKGIEFSLFFQGVGNVTRFIGDTPIEGQGGNQTQGNVYAEVLEKRWTLENPDPNAQYPRMQLSTHSSNRQESTLRQRDMSYMRLKNAELAYTFPKKWTQKFACSKLRLYVQGVNLLTFSKFKMWDPELSSECGGVYPNLKVVTFGINLNF